MTVRVDGILHRRKGLSDRAYVNGASAPDVLLAGQAKSLPS